MSVVIGEAGTFRVRLFLMSIELNALAVVADSLIELNALVVVADALFEQVLDRYFISNGRARTQPPL